MRELCGIALDRFGTTSLVGGAAVLGILSIGVLLRAGRPVAQLAEQG
jgi:hypothetical protein